MASGTRPDYLVVQPGQEIAGVYDLEEIIPRQRSESFIRSKIHE